MKNDTQAGKAGKRSKFTANVGVHPGAPAAIATYWTAWKDATMPLVNMKMANLVWEPTKCGVGGRWSAKYLRDPKMRS